jgi:predicted RNA-binding Zn ribbon-like protein
LLFAHDTEVALAGMAALVNTATAEAGDTLVDLGGLDAFVTEWGWNGGRTHDEAELSAVRALRPRLRRLWGSSEDEAVDLVNELLRESRALPRLVRHDGWSYHLHATEADAPLARRMAVEAAMAMVDVIRSNELRRLRVCAAGDCNDVMVDLSKNRSRRFCDTTCANRVNVAAFRARRASAAPE